uniref:Surfactant protein C n=1 Tax=Varanus komodoensis TaxID=61221 RepID=A0A8D2IY87_VARKO
MAGEGVRGKTDDTGQAESYASLLSRSFSPQIYRFIPQVPKDRKHMILISTVLVLLATVIIGAILIGVYITQEHTERVSRTAAQRKLVGFAGATCGTTIFHLPRWHPCSLTPTSPCVPPPYFKPQLPTFLKSAHIFAHTWEVLSQTSRLGEVALRHCGKSETVTCTPGHSLQVRGGTGQVPLCPVGT